MLLKKIAIQLIGDSQTLTLAQRMLNGVFFGAMVGDLIAVIFLSIGDLSSSFINLLSFYVFLSLVGYICTRVYQKFVIGLFLYVLMQVSILLFEWKDNSGVSGTLTLSFVTFLILDYHLFPRKYSNHVLLVGGLLFMLFVFLELTFPEVIVYSNISKYTHIVHWLIMIIFSLSVLILFRNEYDKAQILLTKQKEELKEAYLKEKELNGLKNQFISMVSHQFRTPMTVIHSSTELIELHTAQKLSINDKEKVNKQFHRIYDSIDGITTMMERVLAFGEVESNKINFRPTKEDLVGLLEQLILRYPLSSDIHKQALIVKGDPIQVNIDKNLIEHSVSNLISNAIKYDTQSRFPQIIINFQDEHLELSVIDKGIGIPEDDQEKLFTPFHRAKNVGTYKGTGIGLAVVKHFIELHGGKILIRSKVNEGSEFTIKLPYRSSIESKKVEA
ncbi:sensor histidine kinase [Sediminitomix flava]|uniref:histidine kinase n=1 Tax=Sediminitomix flava TaxID=379075 RepID=A0A316A059_SEDFL|nr:HAMP domain-containing sensor histidine kinase [Sediminitomix flava]PWJ43027.1 signal transduction histidine kinase [Sediminitomix flava]